MDRPPRDSPEVAWRVGVLLGQIDALDGRPPTPRTWVVRPDLFPSWERPAATDAVTHPFVRPPARKKAGDPLAEGEKRAKKATQYADYGVRRDGYLRLRAKIRADCAAAWEEGAETVACAGCGDAIPSPHHYCGACQVAQEVVREGILFGHDAPERRSETPETHQDQP